jgi:signal transduction histidine kinase
VWHSLVDLLTNASRFTAAGRIEVRLSATCRCAKSFVRVEVRDTGTGIPAELLARGELFLQPFVTAQPSKEFYGKLQCTVVVSHSE